MTSLKNINTHSILLVVFFSYVYSIFNPVITDFIWQYLQQSVSADPATPMYIVTLLTLIAMVGEYVFSRAQTNNDITKRLIYSNVFLSLNAIVALLMPRFESTSSELAKNIPLFTYYISLFVFMILSKCLFLIFPVSYALRAKSKAVSRKKR